MSRCVYLTMAKVLWPKDVTEVFLYSVINVLTNYVKREMDFAFKEVYMQNACPADGEPVHHIGHLAETQLARMSRSEVFCMYTSLKAKSISLLT